MPASNHLQVQIASAYFAQGMTVEDDGGLGFRGCCRMGSSVEAGQGDVLGEGLGRTLGRVEKGLCRDWG
jgi:hypothetical protein